MRGFSPNSKGAIDKGDSSHGLDLPWCVITVCVKDDSTMWEASPAKIVGNVSLCWA